MEIPTPGVLDYQAKNKMSKSFFHDIHLTWICCCLTSKFLISPNNISHLAFLLPFYLALEGGSWNCWHFLPPGTAQSWTSLFLNLLRGLYGLGKTVLLKKQYAILPINFGPFQPPFVQHKDVHCSLPLGRRCGPNYLNLLKWGGVVVGKDLLKNGLGFQA